MTAMTLTLSSPGSSVWQQVLALDARYNACRTPSNPHFRTLYIRRRSQLLRENAKKNADTSIRRQYLRNRSQLLAQRYGYVPSEGSTKSRSLSMRSNSQLTLEGEISETIKKTSIVPTTDAEASRALVGNTSLSENYSFAGVHHICEKHAGAITRLKWANDERTRLAMASLDGTLSICLVSEEPNTSSLTTVTLSGHTAGVTDFEWSVSNDLIVSCSLDCTVRVWNPNSGECIRIVSDTQPILCCAFQPLNNNLVVTGNNKGIVQVLNISTGIYIKMGASKTAGAALSMCCDNNGKLLWVGDDRGNVFSFLMDVATGKLIKGRRFTIAEGAHVTSLVERIWVSREARDPLLLANCSPDSLYLFRVSNTDGSMQLKKKFAIKQSSHAIRSNFCPLMSFRLGVCILTGSEDGCVHLLDIEKETGRAGSSVNTLHAHSHPVLDVAFNHDESFLASGDSNSNEIMADMKLKGSS